jgi:SAM-dependent methyltransferase
MARFEALQRMRTAAAFVEPSRLAVRPFRCPICGPSLLVRFSSLPLGVRCVRCAGSAATLALVCALTALRPRLAAARVYEMSSRGPLVSFLRREAAELTCSEYFDGVAPGAWRDGVQCQDVQRLTYPDASFDVCTSTEVFEHVPDDAPGFAEIRRVLRPGGVFLFTVPLSRAARTVERALVRNGVVEHLLPAEYHGDRLRGHGKVLVFRDYGIDIVERLLRQRFARAWIDIRFSAAFLGSGAPVVAAEA